MGNSEGLKRVVEAVKITFHEKSITVLFLQHSEKAKAV
jgi:hypothetical protein